VKYYPDHRLFFIHIPKCAGVSVNHALERVSRSDAGSLAEDLGIARAEDALGLYRLDDPVLGPIHPAHVPLKFLRQRFPATWAALRRSRSFALTRDPRARFLSALMQHLREFEDVGPIRADDPRLADDAARVCDWLGRRGSFADLEYIHFSRQVDYVDLDGERIADAIFPVDRTEALAAWLTREVGLKVSIAHAHARRQPKPWARPIQPVARFAGRNLLPRGLKEILHPIWTRSGAFADAASAYGKVELGAEVEQFLAHYYAADAALHAEAMARTGADSGAPDDRMAGEVKPGSG
jgi:hypothetical protein